MLISLFCADMFGQEARKITGTVYDSSNGETLAGAYVVEEGTQNGTSTDALGNYALTVTSGKLSVSYLGYNTQEVILGKGNVYNVRLVSENKLNEIVFVGYGTQKKSDLTGSIASISNKDIKNYASSNISGMMAGKAAGVFVASSSGQPGSESVVRIRGLSTVNNNNPLYVVDGQFMDNINSLNPSDIANIEILKDASACAIYGSKGSNGVILINTKSGITGKTIVSLDAYVGMKDGYKSLNMMNSKQFYDFILKSYEHDENFQNSMKTKFTNQYNKGYDTDWWKKVSRTGFNQNYNLSIRTGNDKSKTALSLGFMDDEGSIITTDFKRFSLRLNQEYNINKYVTVGTNINIASMRQRRTETIPYFNFILKADPFTPVINPLVDPSSENYEYNKYAPTEWSYDPNPVSLLRIPTHHDDWFNVFGNVFAKVNIVKGLSYRVQYNFERDHNMYKLFWPVYSATFSDDNLANMESKYNTETKLTNESAVTFNYSLEQRLNYNLKLGKHQFDVMAACTYEKNDEQNINAFRTHALGNDDIYQILDAQTRGDQATGGREVTSMLSFLGRINYNYEGKYLATVNFRADGSSRFAKGNRWGYFPSVSLGWKISKENFFKDLNISNVVSSLKIRAGWGQNGNQRIDANAPLTLIGTNNEKQWYFGSGYLQGYVPTYQGNSDIKWETSQQTNIGLDISMFKYTLDVSIDGYVKKTKDMLLQMPVPDFGAFANDPYFNAGDLKNTGFELTAKYHNSIGNDFHYNVGFNISRYRTKVTTLTSEYLSGNVSRTYVGGPIGRFWGYRKIGIFQTQEEINNYVAEDGSVIQPNAKPGDFKFAKFTKEGALNANDRTFIGNPNPDYIYGFNLGFSYKNFDLSMSFQGTIGNDIWNSSKGDLGVAGLQNSLADAYTKAWKQEGDTKAKYPRMTTSDDNDNFRTSSFYVENGSYLRLQNMQIGYNIPEKICKKTNLFSSCRVYVSGQNLFTITGYSGLDPEIGIDNPLNMGVDKTHYPSSRVLTFGINLQF